MINPNGASISSSTPLDNPYAVPQMNPYQQAVNEYLKSQGVDPGTAMQASGVAAQAQASGQVSSIVDGAKIGMMLGAKRGGAALAKGSLFGGGSAAAAQAAGASEASLAGSGASLAGGEASLSAAGGAGGVTGAASGGGAGAGLGSGASSTLMTIGAPLAVAGLGAYTAKTAYDAFSDASGQGFGKGLKQGIKDAGILNFVPVLGQAAWLAGALGGAFGHKSTRVVAHEHTGQLLKQGKDNQAWQDYVAANRAQFNAPPPDKANPFGDTKGNKFKTFAEYKAHGLDAGNLLGVYGNLKVAGPDWVKLAPAQQMAFTQYAIDNNLYDSKKGEVVINDEKKARDYLDTLLKAAPASPAPAMAHPILQLNPGAAPANVQAIPRSMTQSPGISKSGKRISY